MCEEHEQAQVGMEWTNGYERLRLPPLAHAFALVPACTLAPSCPSHMAKLLQPNLYSWRSANSIL